MSQFMTQVVSDVRHICGTAKPVCGQLEYVMSRDPQVMRQTARRERMFVHKIGLAVIRRRGKI